MHDFAGAPGVSAVNYLMVKRALPAVLGFLTLCLPLAAQTNRPEQTDDETITVEQLRRTGAVDTTSALTLYQPSIFCAVDNSVLIHGLPALTLLDGRRFLFSSALGPMGMMPLDLFPVAFFDSRGSRESQRLPNV